MKNKITFLSLIAAAALAATTAEAISYDAATDGVNAPTGATFSATGGVLVASTDASGLKFLGVDGATDEDEIEWTESLTIAFDGPTALASITLGLLFDGPEFGDVSEIAVLTADGVEYALQATSATTAAYSYAGAIVSNISPATGVTSAVWQISNPFVGLVTEIVLTARGHAGQKWNGSDFGLVAFSTAVPDSSTTLALLGLSFLCIAAVRRGKKN